MEQVAAEENLRRALAAVKRNHGAAGIDGMTTEQLESHLRRHGEKIRAKLLAGRWTPSPVRRIEIPKPNGDKRLLGIPTVMDRLLQQALLQVLQPIFEPLFSESSWGFRPGRSAHDAVRAAQGYVREGRDWVVDIDIAKFFDHVNHDILMRRIAPVIRDKRILSQDYRFGHPGTDSIAESRLRCNVFRTAFTFDPAFFAGPVFRSGPVKALRQRQRPL